MEDKAVRGFSWTFLGLGLNKGLATATTIVLAALLTPADFGLVAIGLVVVNFATWFGGSSFGATLIVHQELDDRGQGTVLSLSLLGSAAAALTTVALAPVLAGLLDQPRLTAVLATLSVSLLVGGLSSFYEALLQSRLEFRRRFEALLTQTVSFTASAILLAVLGAGVWSLVVAQLLSAVLFTGVLLTLSPWLVRPDWDRAQVSVLFTTGRGFATQGITSFLRQNADVVAVGRSFGAASIGIYTMAFRLGDLTYSALTDPIVRVAFPAFARSRARDEDIRPVFLRLLRLVALLTVPCGAMLSAASEPLTRTFFASEWSPMVGVLAVVGVWAAVRPIEAMLGWLLNALGHANAVARAAVVVLLPLFAALALIVAEENLALVVVVPLADALLSFGIRLVLIRRHVGLPVRTVGRAVSKILLAGVACWVITRVTAEALAEAPGPVALAIAISAGSLAYVGVLLVVDRPLVRSTIRQGARLVGRGPIAA